MFSHRPPRSVWRSQNVSVLAVVSSIPQPAAPAESAPAAGALRRRGLLFASPQPPSPPQAAVGATVALLLARLQAALAAAALPPVRIPSLAARACRAYLPPPCLIHPTRPATVRPPVLPGRLLCGISVVANGHVCGFSTVVNLSAAICPAIRGSVGPAGSTIVRRGAIGNGGHRGVSGAGCRPGASAARTPYSARGGDRPCAFVHRGRQRIGPGVLICTHRLRCRSHHLPVLLAWWLP